MKTFFTLFIIISTQTNVLSAMDDIFKKRKSEDTLQSNKKNKQSNSEVTEEFQVNELYLNDLDEWQLTTNLPATSEAFDNNKEFPINYYLNPVSIDNKTEFKCSFKKCNFTTDDIDSLQNHYKQHNDEQIYKCDYEKCSFTTKYKKSLITHKYKHTGEKPYHCQICQYCATTSSSIKSHMKNHGANKQFACNKCNYSCNLSAALERHLKKHH